MKIGDEVFVHGYIDEIRKDTVIISNNGGYFGTIPSEVIGCRFGIYSQYMELNVSRYESP